MITKQMKALMSVFPFFTESRRYGYECKTTGGSTVYIAKPQTTNIFSKNFQTNQAFSAGIVVGSGTTQPSENDYALESIISSGISAISTSEDVSSPVDGSGNPQLKFLLELKNTSSSDITISEIGAISYLSCASTQTGYVGSSGYFLLDRTLLDAPITLHPDDIATIQYVIKKVEQS